MSAIAVTSALADWAARDRAAPLRLFVPAARTLAASARIALGHALRESAWMGSDAIVNRAKGAWWLEELALSERGTPRHPLTCFLTGHPDPLDFAKLSHEFARLRVRAPDEDVADVLEPLSRLERALWFGAAPVDEAACVTRARAILIDVLERSGRLAVSCEGKSSAAGAACAHAEALRVSPAADDWTAARRAQALVWLNVRGNRATVLPRSRWREVWTVWCAVQAVHWRWRGRESTKSGDRHGT